MLVMLWSNVWLILLPLISFVFRLLKYAIEWVQWFVTSGYQEVASQELESVRVWCEQRLEVLLPTPFRGVISMLLKGDNRVQFQQQCYQQIYEANVDLQERFYVEVCCCHCRKSVDYIFNSCNIILHVLLFQRLNTSSN